MSDDIKDTLYNIYECFLLRDLAYIFGGSLVMGSIYFVFNRNIIIAIDYITQNFFKFLIFLFFSYFLGVIVSDLVQIIRIKKFCIIKPEHLSTDEFDFLMLMAGIRKKWGVNSVRRIERVIYFRKLSAVICSASLVSFLILFIPLISCYKIVDIVIVSSLIICTVVCLIVNRQTHRGLMGSLKDYAKIIADLGEKVK